jgi:putative nucleotidyltransferase with HDIG domain
MGSVRRLSSLVASDSYTERHSRRVALLVVQVGTELGLSPGRLRTLSRGALLHDIGKVAISREILDKPGPLTELEYETVKEHPERGYELLGELGGFSEEVRGLVRDHHERLDGQGYPRGLSGSELSLDARILTVCDVYDALRSKRVYREAWAHEDAMALLRSETGKAFDGRCVEALAGILEAASSERRSRAQWLFAPSPSFSG